MELPIGFGFIGVDPGVTCGIAWCFYAGKWDTRAASCDPDGMRFILESVLCHFAVDLEIPVLVCGEKFVTGNKPGTKGVNADVTRASLSEVEALAKLFANTHYVAQTAAEVKPWATDRRLAAIGFPLAPKMKDSRDAGRHMLFGAVRSGRAADPLR
jgi:hypothetical protein